MSTIRLPSGHTVTLGEWQQQSSYETIDVGYRWDDLALLWGLAADLVLHAEKAAGPCPTHAASTAMLVAVAKQIAARKKPIHDQRRTRSKINLPDKLCSQIDACTAARQLMNMIYKFGPKRGGLAERVERLATDVKRLHGVDTDAIIKRWQLLDTYGVRDPYALSAEDIRAAYAADVAGWDDVAREILRAGQSAMAR